MFKLIRLAIYAMVGYAVYGFVRDVIEMSEQPTQERGRRGSGQRKGGTRMTGARRGGGQGKSVATQETDGSSTRHRVGRGVV